MLGLSTLLFSGIAAAGPACNGFEIKIKNHLADDLLVTGIKLNGADFQPDTIQKLDSKQEQVFTVNNSNDDVPMHAELSFKTISLPIKSVKIQFDLKNKGLICKHSDSTPDSDYSVDKTRTIGGVSYTILNK